MAPELGEARVGVSNGTDHHAAQVPHVRLVQQAEGPACVLAMGTANPPDIIEQSTYHERLFAMCGISDNETLKAKFKRMGEYLGPHLLVLFHQNDFVGLRVLFPHCIRNQCEDESRQCGILLAAMKRTVVTHRHIPLQLLY